MIKKNTKINLCNPLKYFLSALFQNNKNIKRITKIPIIKIQELRLDNKIWHDAKDAVRVQIMNPYTI